MEKYVESDKGFILEVIFLVYLIISYAEKTK